MKNIIRISLAALVVGLMFTGCKKDSPTENTPATEPPSTNPPATQTNFPTGAFTATDVDGIWVQIFYKDSSFALSKNGVAMFDEGRYIPSGNQIVLSENSSVCANKGNGAYAWTFDGTTLKFSAMSDGCASRKKTLTSNNWTRKQ